MDGIGERTRNSMEVVKRAADNSQDCGATNVDQIHMKMVHEGENRSSPCYSSKEVI